MLWRQVDDGSVDVATKRRLFLSDLTDLFEAKDLEAATVG